jgi:CubicO group peptidase (beta-lactamase class C family)
MTEISGTTAPGWEPVADAFRGNFNDPEELGAGVSVYHRGRCVVDLQGGHADRDRTRAYDADALQLVFSTTKGITAIAVAICAQRGLLDYDAPVSSVWPEFAAAGKGDLTIAQLLSHQCGLVTIDEQIALADALNWSTITEKLAAQQPLWEPGTAHGYHALTFGWLAGELVRRVDPAGRSLGGFVADEIVAAVGGGAELWIGLPAAQLGRVSLIQTAPPPSDPATIALMREMMGPDTLGGRALSLNGAFATGPNGTAFNLPEVLAAEVPAANGVTNARSLARIYAACIGEVDGRRLLDDATRTRASTTVTPPGEIDRCLHIGTTFGMGFMTHGAFTAMAGPGSFGHPGAGGSVAFAHPDSGISFAYVMNQMASNLAGDLRAQRLVDAAVACAAAA